MIVRDLISAALRKIGAIAPGENMSAQEAMDALGELNRMLSSWSTESLIIFAKIREEFALTPDVSKYTMGPGADFSTIRPIQIVAAGFRLGSNPPGLEIPVKVIQTANEWAEVCNKDFSAGFPLYLMVEGTYPVQTLDVYPKPASAGLLSVYSERALESLGDLDSDVILPAGYEQAIVYGLAIQLAPEYGRPVTAEIATIANDSKANIKRSNEKANFLRVDAALLPVGERNIYTGGIQ